MGEEWGVEGPLLPPNLTTRRAVSSTRSYNRKKKPGHPKQSENHAQEGQNHNTIQQSIQRDAISVIHIDETASVLNEVNILCIFTTQQTCQHPKVIAIIYFVRVVVSPFSHGESETETRVRPKSDM